MIDEEKVVSGGDVADNSTDYIETIKTLKENTVSKEQFLKLKEENKKLLNAWANGQGNPNGESTPAPKKDIKELKEHLMTDGISNLDYVSTALELRERILEEQGIDTFLPNATTYVASDADISAANKVAKELQDMVDIADGNADIFNNEFQRRVADINIPRRK